MAETLLLTQSDLIRCGATDIDLVGDCLEEMFVVHAQGRFTAPPSSFLKREECPHVADRIIGLSAYLGGRFDVEGIKWIASAHRNPSVGLPRANAVIILNDAENRQPIAIMEGALISAMRTAVVQGLAARYLARTDARSVGLIGAGRIGALVLYVLDRWFPKLDSWRVFDLLPERTQAFAEHMGRLGVDIEPVSRFEEALMPADIGVVATTAAQAYVPPECFKEGALFMNVSLMDPTYELVELADKIVVDDWMQCTHSDRVLARMVKQGMLSRDDLHAEFGEVVEGRRPGRENAQERIFWNPFGLAIEDLAVAMTLYHRACVMGLGASIDLVDQEWDVLFSPPVHADASC
ncbi:MAG: 2,3-diaminopropionate biosynthesis protein SbnB [Chromatiales bacterium]|jgi:ornithine cyclodeaminase